jgi:hypothetical protein
VVPLTLITALSRTPTVETIAIYSVVVVGVIVGVVLLFLHFQRRDRVLTTSAALKQLDELNRRTAPLINRQAPIHHQFRYVANSKGKYDRFDLVAFMRMQVLEYEGWFTQEINSRVEATRNYEKYRRSLDIEARSLLGTSTHPRVKPGAFEAIELRLFEKRQLRYPMPAASVSALVSYTSPQGQNSYSRGITWEFHHLVEGLQSARDERARQSSVQAMRARERQLMTPKLRMDILRRDGFRCRMCGASGRDGIALHIDHIVPVSHGGRTVETNLQALCDACNTGKSNHFVG